MEKPVALYSVTHHIVYNIFSTLWSLAMFSYKCILSQAFYVAVFKNSLIYTFIQFFHSVKSNRVPLKVCRVGNNKVIFWQMNSELSKYKIIYTGRACLKFFFIIYGNPGWICLQPNTLCHHDFFCRS